MTVIIILFYFLFPALILYLGTKYKIINAIGVVVFCYVGGLLVGNIGIMPDQVISATESGGNISGTLMGVSLLLGIPLVLLSENIFQWVRKAKYTFLSLLLGVLSVVVMVFAGFFLFRNHIPEADKIGGMLIGVYTGGTPNLAEYTRERRAIREKLLPLGDAVRAYPAHGPATTIGIEKRFNPFLR